MRLGVVQGRVVLSAATPEMAGITLLIVEPVTSENLQKGGGKGGGKALVAADNLGANLGQMVAIVEGREAANPYWPDDVPVDVYCSLIVNSVDYYPPVPTS
jgi:microcompartment protein CcmK/EutM